MEVSLHIFVFIVKSEKKQIDQISQLCYLLYCQCSSCYCNKLKERVRVRETERKSGKLSSQKIISLEWQCAASEKQTDD